MKSDNRNYKITKNDGIIMLCIVLIYGVISFFNLGSTVNPQTFWTPSVDNESVVIDLGEVQDVEFMRRYNGARFGDFKLYTSNDNDEYTFLMDMPASPVFLWEDIDLKTTARYIKIECVDVQNPGILGEVAVVNNKFEVIPAIGIEQGELLVDEGYAVPEDISYMNSTYFDEIYHGRTAYEFVHGMKIYEWTHPPLGKLIMAVPVKLFGMSTFSYRVMGNIAGILMLVVIYLLAKRIFGSTKYAALASIIMAADGMHFVQTRIGTVDSFLVLFMMCSAFFMYEYTQCKTEDSIKPKLLNLLGSGFFLGCSIATKWTGAYLAVGLAVIFFIDLYERFKSSKNTDDWNKQWKIIILSCFGFFVAIPILIYILVYIPKFLIDNNYGFVEFIVKEQIGMYNYHSNLEATHPYSSPWYFWPIGYKPVWYYSGKVEQGMVSSISCHSNPFIWWTGIAGMAYVFVKAIKEKSKKYRFIAIGILSLYVPYMLIPRIMYLYHYFPIIPFMILGIVGTIKYLDEEYKRNISLIYVIIAIIVFMICYPIYSGFTVPSEWASLVSLNGVWKLY